MKFYDSVKRCRYCEHFHRIARDRSAKGQCLAAEPGQKDLFGPLTAGCQRFYHNAEARQILARGGEPDAQNPTEGR